MPDEKKPAQKLRVDPEKCIACGTCVAMYPEIFEFTEDGTKARVKKDADLSGKDLKELVAACPSNAIVAE